MRGTDWMYCGTVICVDHIRQKHSLPSSVKFLGRWFPLWQVTRAAWRKALKPQVSGVSTDVLLFSESGSSLVHHCRVFGQSAAHTSLRGKSMGKLRSFTIWAEAEARWESGCLQIRKTQLPAVSDTLCSIRPQDPDYESPLCKTRRALSPVVLEVSAGTTSSTVVSSVTSYARAPASCDPPALRPHWLLYGGRSPIFSVLMPLPPFAATDHR